MKLSEYRGQEAIKVMGAIMVPVTRILTDPVIQGVVKGSDATQLDKATAILNGHSKDVLDILAIMDGVDINDKAQYAAYEERATIPYLIKGLMEVIEDPDMRSLFF